MYNPLVKSLSIVLLSLFLVTNMGCGIKNKNLRTLGAIIVVGVAAKLIYDMVIEHQTQEITNEKAVVEQYKKEHQALPSEATLVSYHANIEPGQVVNVGKSIVIASRLQVVRGVSSQKVDIKEKITIFDNDDNNKEIKSFIKTINKETQRSGEFANEFKFKLPKGMPQGIYPIKTQVIIDGKATTPVENRMQLVMFDLNLSPVSSLASL